MADQSIFVRAAVQGVIREAVIAACLTGADDSAVPGKLAQHADHRGVDSALDSDVDHLVLSALGETINIMTLGGLALAVGILVDDATVTIENIESQSRGRARPDRQAILDGAPQIAVPALVSTLCICIVFLPMFFLTRRGALSVRAAGGSGGVRDAGVLPAVAHAGADAGDVPAARPRAHGEPAIAESVRAASSSAFERGFERLRDSVTSRLLTGAGRRPALFVAGVSGGRACAAFLLVPWLGQDFFPATDSGQFNLHVRAKTGTRIEETARLCDLVEKVDPPRDSAGELDEHPRQHRAAVQRHQHVVQHVGARSARMDADILVSLKQDHRPTADYVRKLRATLPREFPGVTFYFLPADIVTPDPELRLARARSTSRYQGNDVRGQPRVRRRAAATSCARFRGWPICASIRRSISRSCTSTSIAPRPRRAGFTQRDVANSLLISLSGSFQTTPTFWLNPQNGVSYSLVAQTPQYPHAVAAGSARTFRSHGIDGDAAARFWATSRSIRARRRHGGGLALQHPPRHRHLRRRCRIAISARVAGDINRIVDANRKLAAARHAASPSAARSRR